MADHFPNLHHVQFFEHPFSEPTQTTPDDFAIIISGPFSTHQFCQNLFQKIFTIGLSEIAAFLDYHCNQVENPNRWLNSLEKLIKLNVDLFETRPLQHRHTKLISQIDIKRLSLQLPTTLLRKHSKKLNGYSDEKEYSFADVREHLKTYETLEEKIALLQDQIIDYRQNPPDFICTKEQPFDHQCNLEIERLEKQELLYEKINRKKNNDKQGHKMPFNGNLNFLCDVYYKLMMKRAPNGKLILPWSITQATEHICNSFCEADGSSLSPTTVRTYLSPSKPESRPNSENEMDI
ncbi:MAG: hypothetical protein IH597_07545 [Bacteroidales bacterium]|nr:hypothetical protein [Bacteroidales bacterium]